MRFAGPSQPGNRPEPPSLCKLARYTLAKPDLGCKRKTHHTVLSDMIVDIAERLRLN